MSLESPEQYDFESKICRKSHRLLASSDWTIIGGLVNCTRSIRDEGATATPDKTTTLIEFRRRSSAGVRILLADDFARWRSQLRSFLQCETEWKIICEACDGIEAVQKTVELNPDVVLLDLNMPGLNGIAATRRIHQLSPNCKIVIFSQDGSEDLRTAALEAGAAAYVLKAEMASRLIPAIQSTLRT